MKVIKYIILIVVFIAAIAYVDIKLNAMVSKPEILVFENLKAGFLEVINSVLKR